MGGPKTAKGSMRKIEVSCASWIDLLGYGSMLEEAHFDPTHPSATAALERTSNFHDVVSERSCRYLPTFVMNDGAVAYRDMSPRAKTVTYDFLSRSIELFNEVNRIDKTENGHPGARMVIAPGFRVRREIDFDPLLHQGKGKRIKEKFDEGSIDANQAVNAALKVRSYSDSTPELQANFAMAKAFIAESCGSNAGLSGASCFIDLSIFESQLPEWIVFSEFINWQGKGMSATFGRFESINNNLAAKNGHAGILDAFEIAEAIGTSEEVVSKLRESKVTNLR